MRITCAGGFLYGRCRGSLVGLGDLLSGSFGAAAVFCVGIVSGVVVRSGGVGRGANPCSSTPFAKKNLAWGLEVPPTADSGGEGSSGVGRTGFSSSMPFA